MCVVQLKMKHVFDLLVVGECTFWHTHRGVIGTVVSGCLLLIIATAVVSLVATAVSEKENG